MMALQRANTGYLRQRLARTCLPEDPCCIGETVARHLPGGLRAILPAELVAAGVLIPIVERASDLSVLFTERSPDLKHHAGQISFPGGRMEPGDLDIRWTALRETQEEIGIAPDRIEVIGSLEPLPTITGYVVTPVVGLVTGDLRLKIDPIEVAGVFEVPLEFLLDERNQRHSTRDFEGVQVPVLEYQFESYRIWGATASMVRSLSNLLKI
jgi:8-oxo-dGTP pyrophosphatase MutT (NUDIX family)